MKKTILNVFVAFTLLLTISCKNESKTTSNTEEKIEKTTEASKEAAVKTETSPSSGTPNFSNSDVQEYVNMYETYIEDYKKAVESKDMNAFATLGQKGQELATKGQEAMSKLSGADVQKLTDYMTKKAKEMQELSQKMMQ